MSQGYSKEFLVSAYMFRFCEHGLDSRKQEQNAEAYYDKVGKDKFREAASLDAAEIKRYKEFLSCT